MLPNQKIDVPHDIIYAYTSSTDGLILQAIAPWMLQHHPHLTRCYWERHYAGGSHLRIHIAGPDAHADHLRKELCELLRKHLSNSPSEPDTRYDPSVIRRLLEMEEEAYDPDDLTYRVNIVEVRKKLRTQHPFASDAAALLLEQFLHETTPLAIRILQSSHPLLETAVQLYFLEAFVAGGDVPNGSVSFKSHWHGLAAFTSKPQLNDRILDEYERNKSRLHELLAQVVAWTSTCSAVDGIFWEWVHILQRFEALAQELLLAGTQLTFQLSSAEQAITAREKVEAREGVYEAHPFLATLWKDERFLASFQFEPSLLVPRVLTNLLYSFIAGLGLRFVDKMALCLFAHRAVEDFYQVDLTNILHTTVESIVTKHQDRHTSGNHLTPDHALDTSAA